MRTVAGRIAEELAVREEQVAAAIRLLDGGATVPFVARYRKEATGGLDDTQLRMLEKRTRYLRELDDRRAAVQRSLEEQGVLTPELRRGILAADTLTRLEDLYLPFRPKRRTKAQIAREAGLAPLAERLLHKPDTDPEAAASAFVDAAKGIVDTASALEGARHILMEQLAEDPALVGPLRDRLWERGLMTSRVARGAERESAKFSDYFDFAEPIRSIPSHRALALFRGSNEGVLRLSLTVDEDERVAEGTPGACERAIAAHAGIRSAGRPADTWLAETVRATWRTKLRSRLETDLFKRLRDRAEEEAIAVFGNNLRDLLLAAPAGPRVTLGLDPGLRTGVKGAVIDATGKLLATATIYPHAPRGEWNESIATLARLAAAHRIELVGIGNGTASRETDRLVADLMKRHPELHLTKVMVSEAGASVYSASELAARELPDLDVSLRGAVSIARRLQDPLAELVKIEPKAIGVGQYQHDVSETELARTLGAVVEDCVTSVGVDVNTASAALLSRVSGLGTALAASVVGLRDRRGAFRSRRAFMEVPRLGAKAFEQCAGFLRVMNGENPIDASAVHPEAYPVVERIAHRTGRRVSQLIGDTALLRTLHAADFTDDVFGEPTVRDILSELEKPGRDPRPKFETAAFKEGVESMEDLRPGMVLEGVVTNVANFGAFVDVGVHQDGLVHVSAMSHSFVRDPRQVAKVGAIVKVRVLSVDLERKRISLSMRIDDDAGGHRSSAQRERERHPSRTPR
jgi:protein Tex